jgi:hypothetical protein
LADQTVSALAPVSLYVAGVFNRIGADLSAREIGVACREIGVARRH